VKPSTEWLTAIGAEFSAGSGISGCAQLTNYTVDYREWGEGSPIVLVPGMAGGFELLGPLARLLAANHRVISYQLRGEDNCFALRRPFDLQDLVSDLGEFLDWLCLEKPTVLGVSFGGVLALEFAARYPYRLDRLIVQGVGARFERGLIEQVASTVLNRFPLPVDNPFVNQFFNLLFGARQDNEALFEFVTQRCWQTDQSVMAHRFRLLESFDMEAKLRRIRVPTLVLSGDRDVLVSPRSLSLLRDGLKHAQFARLPSCGHLAFITRPDLVAAKVQQFLQY
jgi:pimeloyl-ACP methyl ester carboxylesterase